MNEYQPCPKCSGTDAQRVNLTWWGGVLGPKVLTHVKCPDCKTTYNGKTGQSNTTYIILYSLVIFAVTLAIFGFISFTLLS